MKKSIIITLIIITLISVTFVLTGCNKGGTVQTLKTTYNGKESSVTFEISDSDKTDDFDEEYPETITIRNSEKNYVLYLTLYVDQKDSYESSKADAKNEVEGYSETKFGKYDGYIGTGVGEVYGNILLDTKNDIYKTVAFTVCSNGNTTQDETMKIYKSKDVQNILDSFKF